MGIRYTRIVSAYRGRPGAPTRSAERSSRALDATHAERRFTRRSSSLRHVPSEFSSRSSPTYPASPAESDSSMRNDDSSIFGDRRRDSILCIRRYCIFVYGRGQPCRTSAAPFRVTDCRRRNTRYTSRPDRVHEDCLPSPLDECSERTAEVKVGQVIGARRERLRTIEWGRRARRGVPLPRPGG